MHATGEAQYLRDVSNQPLDRGAVKQRAAPADKQQFFVQVVRERRCSSALGTFRCHSPGPGFLTHWQHQTPQHGRSPAETLRYIPLACLNVLPWFIVCNSTLPCRSDTSHPPRHNWHTTPRSKLPVCQDGCPPRTAWRVPWRWWTPGRPGGSWRWCCRGAQCVSATTLRSGRYFSGSGDMHCGSCQRCNPSNIVL